MKTFAVAKKCCPPGSLPRRMTVASIADSHRHTGRAAVRQILRGPRLQAKLTVGAPNDVYEQEADRVRKKGTGKLSSLENGTLHRAPASMIHRSADFRPPTTVEDLDLAQRVLHTPGDVHAGFTDDSLVSDTPTIATSAAANGFEAKVDTMPKITNTAIMHVLTPPPWAAKTTEAKLGVRYPHYAEVCWKPMQATFSARGRPKDEAIQESVKIHEEQHAEDYETAFNNTIKAWDTKLEAAHLAGTPYPGASDADATTALHAAMGGDPQSIFDDYTAQVTALKNAFHGSPPGLHLLISDLEDADEGQRGVINCRETHVNVSEDPATVKHRKAEKKAERRRQKGK